MSSDSCFEVFCVKQNVVFGHFVTWFQHNAYVTI
jgi:hypothetical protein